MTTEQQPIKLSYNFLGRTGLKVSDICLGCMTLGSRPGFAGFTGLPEEQSIEVINRFAEVGGNFFDTANIYTGGESEEILGKWMESRGERNKWVIATKCGIQNGPNVNDRGSSRRNILASVEASLERLKTNYIDLYYIHSFDYKTDQLETLRTLDDLVRCGKVRYLGCSNYFAYQLQNALNLSQHNGLERFVTIQPQYSLLSRGIEMEIVEACQQNGVGIMPYSPLSGGVLAGKYKKGEDIPLESRLAWYDKVGFKNYTELNDITFNLLDKVKEIGDSIGATMAEVSLRWVMQKEFVTSTIIGASNLRQLDQNLGASRIRLTPEQMQALDEVSTVPLYYPYNPIVKNFIQRRN